MKKESPIYEYFDLGKSVSLRDGFGRALVTLGKIRNDFYLFDADVQGGTGAKVFAETFPDRVIQFGIAEQNMMGAAAGFADIGLIPIVVGFSSFTVMRAHEFLRTAVCYGERNVKICCSHLGIDVGEDGATAQMLEDISTTRSIPNLKVLVPACANEIQPMFKAILNDPSPVYMRIGRSPTPVIYKDIGEIEIGKADTVNGGDDLTIIACGSRVAPSLEVAQYLETQNIYVRVINLRSIKPIDKELIILAAEETGAIVTVEDHNIYGGMGSAVAEVVVTNKPVPMEIVGVKDKFGRSGSHTELNKLYGIDKKSILQAVKKVLLRKV